MVPLILTAFALASIGAGAVLAALIGLPRSFSFPLTRSATVFARRFAVAVALAGLGLGVVQRAMYTDWVHLFWLAQVPLVALFLVSGILLATTWRDDTAGLAARMPSAASNPARRWRSGAWTFLALDAALAFMPLVLTIALPEDRPGPRDLGRPAQRLADLALWGFGGPLPECLAPITEPEIQRGVGHLPREVTVPMGALLIGAWLWIAFCALACTGRALPSLRARRAFFLWAPFVFLLAVQCVGPVSLGWFDPRFFAPVGALDSGIWTSYPTVLSSFGPVLAVALACALAMAALTGGLRRRVEIPSTSETSGLGRRADRG